MSAAPGPLGVLLSNLGTPDAPTPAAVRRYLAEFLSDRRVIPLAPLLWRPILHGVILRTRPRRSAQAYRRVWTEQGSPLLAHSLAIRDALQRELAQRSDAQVCLGMRYGSPSIARALRELRGCARIVALPLYPQYSLTTTASTFDAIARAQRHGARIRFVPGYAADAAYLDACAARIREFWDRRGDAGQLVLSFHGLPKDSVARGDPYAGQCRDSAARIARRLALPDSRWRLAFQSRFGPKEWLRPYTSDTLRELAAQGVRSVDVFCPGFAADCLETLDEIAEEAREGFLAAGGESLRYIPALNDHPTHIGALAGIVERHAA